MKKILTTLTVITTLSLSALSVSAYETVKCSSNPVFAANSCNECFLGNNKAEWSNLGFLKDEWINSSSVDQIVYKEEQEMPVMKNLSPSLVEWTMNPSSDNFWKYTDDFNALYSEDEEAYILKVNQKVDWLESNKGFAYTLTKNKETEWKEIGLLVYSLATHAMLKTGEINPDSSIHKECVLFKSSVDKTENEKAPVKKELPEKELPETGPEIYLFLVLALMLAFTILHIRKKSQ